VIRVALPAHLRDLAQVEREVELDIEGTVSQRTMIDALEARFPALRGTIRDPATGRRRPFVRFFAGEVDLSHDAADDPLPDAVVAGTETLYVVGAIAGG
jgi:molybdopterin converting factor small subunit